MMFVFLFLIYFTLYMFVELILAVAAEQTLPQGEIKAVMSLESS